MKGKGQSHGMEVRKLRRGRAAMTSAEDGECDGLGTLSRKAELRS